MQGNYFDLDDILAECETLPVEFKTDAIDLGYLEQGSGDTDIKVGCKLNLPVWLAKGLHERQYVNLEKPLYFTQKFADSLLVEPKVVNLQSKCFYWYVMGYKICEMFKNSNMMQSQLYLTWMQTALRLRNKEIIDQSSHLRSENGETFKSYLCYIEENLFNGKHDVERFIHSWKSGTNFDANNIGGGHGGGTAGRLLKSTILGKRKRTQI